MQVETKELMDLLNKVRLGDGESPVDLGDDDSFKSNSIDSLTLSSFFFEIEDRYKCSIPDDQIAKLISLRRIADFLTQSDNA